MITTYSINDLDIPSSPEDWLQQLPGPVVIEIPGQDPSRWRVVSTLVHGNEPSGFLAAHRYLVEQRTPATNVAITIASVNAARFETMHRHRFMPGEFDLNRRFGYLKFNDPVTELAHQLTEYIREKCPTAVVDMHNTSGRSPAFAVSISEHPKVLKLASLFTSHMIITQLNVGALMEQNFNCPVVTIECGGSNEPASHLIAYDGLKTFLESEAISEIETHPVRLHRHPVRVTAQNETTLAYADSPLDNVDITLKNSIEDLNFNGIAKGDCIGWLKRPLHNCLEAIGDEGKDCLSLFFKEEDSKIIALDDLSCFMATQRIDIALSDCLFYLLREYR
ncbi:hypothetical protein [Pleionea litopenaei]|uniref:Succinylglutamate desuccinylase n=1 Tax=Pleionea litopenaei TaxID=3070815 RepID=A0AA51X8G8_9GAMM|nr:hypothetical protein [Pleionea sp. HL-JVS1]WMS88914.1 hypothetical protein Q9312_08355 [Pleionea sp. HL-JVS1]